MATKTISLKIEAWERLRRARLTPDESFSEVVLRAEWPERGMTARELRAVYDREGALPPQ
jgi:predicted CopG family antitoxin